MSITVLSEREAKLLKFSAAAAIISISSPRRDQPALHIAPGGRLLRMSFSDAVEESDGIGGVVPRIRRFARGEPLPRRFVCKVYSHAQAQSVAAFVEMTYPSPLYIHCLGGISRSAGMAKAIGEYLGEEVHYGPIVDPNPLVYQRTRHALSQLDRSLAGLVSDWQTDRARAA